MILIALLDRCLTGWHQMGRTVFVLYINQLIARALLLDRCLTGGTARVDYLLRGVRPYVPDAWIDSETLDEIDAELAGVEQQILGLLREVTE
ncbi:hypothetical protein HF669_14190 [Acidithiobacillus thiooxidans]|uniref:hypothetical protein n=1 Tax=Acidithiobacillus thiooxidans TaxID=930 RepID=UPI0002624F7C|nr:hypothetical protein [Acidithiobacillus thiooxidans]MBU2812473.1 hypothetical protein [Acidithiobacillus thiooxidans]